MKVIVAEDNDTSRLVLESVIKKWGFEVSSYNNGVDVWNAFQKETEPGLMILDWMMPGLSGIEVCRLVRERETAMPSYVVLLTACDSKEEIVKGLEGGANDYVVKPFDKNELHARLKVGVRVLELQKGLAHKIQELEKAIYEIKTLRGFVTICGHCHKILNDGRAWDRLEKYIEEHSEAQFSHGICPDCIEKFYPKTSREKATPAAPSNSK
jgi:DNA-binding response OmpR family regulator